jgi:hypothetical protein
MCFQTTPGMDIILMFKGVSQMGGKLSAKKILVGKKLHGRGRCFSSERKSSMVGFFARKTTEQLTAGRQKLPGRSEKALLSGRWMNSCFQINYWLI